MPRRTLQRNHAGVVHCCRRHADDRGAESPASDRRRLSTRDGMLRRTDGGFATRKRTSDNSLTQEIVVIRAGCRDRRPASPTKWVAQIPQASARPAASDRSDRRGAGPCEALGAKIKKKKQAWICKNRNWASQHMVPPPDDQSPGICFGNEPNVRTWYITDPLFYRSANHFPL